jgi:hypothetical protein
MSSTHWQEPLKQQTSKLSIKMARGVRVESIPVDGQTVSLSQTAVDADLLIGLGLSTAQVRSMALRSKKVSCTAYDDHVIGKDP